jgi:hypothetical protein
MTDAPNDNIPHYDDSTPDIEARAMRPSRILQALSPELAPGSDWPEAKQGDLMFSYEDRSEEHYPRTPGVTVQLIACVVKFLEWEPQRGAKKPPIAAYDRMPLDASWRDQGGRKACLRSSNGARIEKTLFAHLLVGTFKASFAFKSTAFDIGERWARDADKVRVRVDNEIVRCCGAFWRLSSELAKNDRGEKWYAPTYELVGLMGQEHGPTIEQVRFARDIRFEFKADEKARLAALSSPLAPTPLLGRAAGSTTFTSGIGERDRPRSWADPGRAEIVAPDRTRQAPRTADPIDDDIPF